VDDREIAVAVAVRCADAFCRRRPWLDRDDARQQATLAALEELLVFDPARGNSIDGFIGQRVNWRLVDWLRREKQRWVRVDGSTYARVPWHPNDTVRPEVEDDDGSGSRREPGAEDMGFALVDAMDEWRRARDRPKQRHRFVRGARLTPMERRVLVGMALGLTAVEDGRRQRRSSETIKTHRRAVIFKLSARNGIHAVALAFAKGELSGLDMREAA
jgi:DNA-binding CsgD family transcriptional regulator